MPQATLPLFTEDMTKVNLHVGVEKRHELCAELSIRKNTFLKALSQKQISLSFLPAEADHREVSTKSSRSVLDNTSGMGKSCTNELARVLASCSRLPAHPTFGKHFDLSHGGLLLTLPSLLACGLLRHISRFESVSGYYTATLCTLESNPVNT